MRPADFYARRTPSGRGFALACSMALGLSMAQSVAAAVVALPAPAAAGFAKDDGASLGSIVYGPGLAAVSGSGINAFGAAYQDSASSTLVSGDPTVAAGGNAGSWAQAALTFSYEVIGPTNAAIPIVLTGKVSAVASPVAGGSAFAQINPGAGFSSTGPLLTICSDLTPACGAGGQKTGSISFSVAANTVQSVYMLAVIDSQTSSSGSFSAFADPTIAIDPSFAQAARYSLLISPGVTGAVPEPEAAALLVLGVLVIGGLARRRTAGYRTAMA